ncbi:dehydrogenase E1 component-domain-containing protein [Lipomyces oligophaga]|uniref:dehydrogenase E1 component-domain-containing protein n=1 Tax=Lipomyces oligophaga TaxID=45792 RepID=UPI0034CDAE7B
MLLSSTAIKSSARALAAFPSYVSAAAAGPARVATRSLATETTISHIPSDPDEEFTVSIPASSFDEYLVDLESYDLKTTKNDLIAMYKDMTTVRRMETAADALYKAKKIRGFSHLSIGEEAIAVGIEHAIHKDDNVITAYRCHGFAYMRGVSVKKVLAELMGRREGASYGKGGSMHIFGNHFYGGNGIVGAQVPVGAGLAFAQHYLGIPHATFALYGDGAANQGQVFEAFNMAKLWKLPCVFACENNKYGMGTAAARSSALTEYHKRGQYIPGIKVDGMDVLAVKLASKFAREYTVGGNGPIVMEYTTYRYGGHSMSDPGTTYRTREEIQRMRSTHDPITGLKDKLVKLGIMTEEELKSIDKEIRAYVDKEVAEAEQAPPPEASPDILFEDVYVKGTEIPILRGRFTDENYTFAK